MTPRTLTRFGLAGAVCLLIGVLAAFLLRPRLPKYNNQPITYWLTNLPSVTVPGSGTSRIIYGWAYGRAEPSEENSRKALAAIRAMGTNALPFLMSKVKRRSPRLPFDNLVRRYSAKLPVIGELLPTQHQVSVEREQAVTGLLALCPLPANTVRELRKMSLDFQGRDWVLAGDILRANENPNLRDEVLNSYFRYIATTRKRAREAAIGGRFAGPPRQFGSELQDTLTETSIWAGVQLELSPRPKLRQAEGFTNSLWRDH